MKFQILMGTCCLIVALSAGCGQPDVVHPQKREIIDAVFGSGHLENQEQYALIAGADGYLTDAYVNEGDSVLSGKVLYRLNNDIQQSEVRNALANLQYARTNAGTDAPQIDQLKIQISQAAQKLRVDSLNLGRYERLIKTQAVSQTDLENAQVQCQSSQANLDVLKRSLTNLQRSLALSVSNSGSQYDIQQQTDKNYLLKSRSAGVIFGVIKKPGDYLKKGDVIAQFASGKIIIKLSIAEEDIARIETGQTAFISFNSNADKILEARITKIYPAFDAMQQAFIVEAALQGNHPVLELNGTQLQANIIVGKHENALVVPSYCIVNGSYVILRDKAAKKKVETGIKTLDWTEIISGLDMNDQVVVPNQN